MPETIGQEVAAQLPASFGRVVAAKTPGIDSFVDAVLCVASEAVQGLPRG